MSKVLTVKERRRIASQNRVRSTMYLPSDVDLDEVDWKPTSGEKRAESNRKNRLAKLDWLEEQQKQRDAAELQYLRARVAVLESVVQADKEFVAAENERDRRRMAAEAETKKIADYYMNEETKALLSRLARATQAINADICRTERQAFEKRGVIRGKRHA